MADVPLSRLVELQIDSYAASPAGEVFDAGCDRAVLTRMPGANVLTVAGTRNLDGWLSDFEAWPATCRDHADIGPVEQGFGDGADGLWAAIGGALETAPLIIQGHSRGGPIATMIAAFSLLIGQVAQRVVLYEAPWGVGAKCRDMLLQAGIPGITYWNGNDPVPTEPDVDYLVPNVWPIERIGQSRLIAIRCHYIEAVAAALKKTPGYA